MTPPSPRDALPDGRAHPAAFFSRAWWRAFRPARTGINTRERLRLVAGSLLGIFLTGLLCHLAGGVVPGLPWLVAPLGASAVLIFAVPASPMAQPWAVVGGNTLSALAGIAGVHGAHLLGSPELAAALAVATAIALMLALRCLHPPGGATALMMVLGGISSPVFAFYPVMLNSVLLVAAGILYNNATRRPYPHTQLPSRAAPSTRTGNSTPTWTPCWRATTRCWTSAATTSRRCWPKPGCALTTASWPRCVAKTSCRASW
jgi:CBS domain-containing membrane protein